MFVPPLLLTILQCIASTIASRRNAGTFMPRIRNSKWNSTSSGPPPIARSRGAQDANPRKGNEGVFGNSQWNIVVPTPIAIKNMPLSWLLTSISARSTMAGAKRSGKL